LAAFLLSYPYCQRRSNWILRSTSLHVVGTHLPLSCSRVPGSVPILKIGDQQPCARMLYNKINQQCILSQQIYITIKYKQIQIQKTYLLLLYRKTNVAVCRVHVCFVVVVDVCRQMKCVELLSATKEVGRRAHM